MATSEYYKLSNFVNSRSGNLFMLGAAELRAVLTPAKCLAALEDAYRHLHAEPDDIGRSLGFQTEDGKIHVKAGLLPGTHKYFAAKINANFPDNPKRYGLPTIQGLIVLCDCTDGRPVAILQSGELTGLRTAAATALAAKYGARPNARTLTLIGCGAQARYQAEAIVGILSIQRIMAVDSNPANAERFITWANETLGIDSVLSPLIADAVAASDITVTCTTGSGIIVTPEIVPAGCFIAAVGADNADKQELDPALFTNACIFVDDLDQCSEGGDLAHAIRANTVTREDVTATLSDLAAGVKPGRTSDNEIVIFDSTGTGLQDVAVAAAAYDMIQTGDA